MFIQLPENINLFKVPNNEIFTLKCGNPWVKASQIFGSQYKFIVINVSLEEYAFHMSKFTDIPNNFLDFYLQVYKLVHFTLNTLK